MLCVHNFVLCYSSNASFRTNSDTAASIGLLLFFWQGGGGAIGNGGSGSMVITGSEFDGNTAPNGNGNNISDAGGGYVTCNDGTNTFKSSGGGEGNDPDGNSPAGLCARACDVNNFDELEEAIGVGGDIKLCSGPIVFTKEIEMTGKELMFTCPNGSCVLDAQENTIFFSILRGSSNISFDGITFKNGSGGGAGAIFNSGEAVVITACKFVGNTAVVS
jgi:hypothetical protein